MAIRFIQLSDPDREPRRIADVLLGQRNEGQRGLLITAEEPGGRVLAFAFAFHFPDINAAPLDFLVVDRTVRQRGVGGASYEVLRDSLKGLGARGLFSRSGLTRPISSPILSTGERIAPESASTSASELA